LNQRAKKPQSNSLSKEKKLKALKKQLNEPLVQMSEIKRQIEDLEKDRHVIKK
jgi:hypothetical protein